MTEKQRLKHIADREPKPVTEGSSLDAAKATPDGLGEWQGGIQALKGAINWVSRKSHPSRTGDFKRTSGKSSSDVVERSAEFYHGKKRDPRYAERAAEEARAAQETALAEHGDVIAQAVSSEPTPAV
jgi:hypothetical protein